MFVRKTDHGSRRAAAPGHSIGNRITRKAVICYLTMGAVLLLGGVAQNQAWAQGRGGANPLAPPPIPGQNPNGMRIFIWGGLKTHGPGQHDYPGFLSDWSQLLTARGAVVDGALHSPTSADLERTDVLIIYKGDAGYLTDAQKTTLEAYVKRGGGIVVLHDSGCGPDPAYFSTLIGGAKKHGETNFTLEAPVRYTVVAPDDPIMKDMSDFTLWDEAFFLMTWAKDPPIHPLVTAQLPDDPRVGEHKAEVVPQIWIYEHALPGGKPARAFVSMQGHSNETFNLPPVKQMLLRAIAWAGQRPVDELVNFVPPARPGRRGAPERGASPAPARSSGEAGPN